MKPDVLKPDTKADVSADALALTSSLPLDRPAALRGAGRLARPLPDLIAQGPQSGQRWRRTLPDGLSVTLGRIGPWAAPWDNLMSRSHATVCWRDGRLVVERLSTARNPILYRGRETNEFSLAPGDHFVIGSTSFTLADEQVHVSGDVPQPVTEQAYSPLFLQRVQFRNASQRIEALARLHEMIDGATNDAELCVRLVNVLLAGIPTATAAFLVAAPPPMPRDAGPIEIRHWDRRQLAGTKLVPSERLIRKALEQDESVLHLWTVRGQAAAFTESEGSDWAFCTPVPGAACRGWALYVTGQFPGNTLSSPHASDPQDLRDDLKFTELVAVSFGKLRTLRLMEQNQANLRPFFSPVVFDALAGRDFEVVLAPREAELAVLFCDLRGFARRSEKAVRDLLGLLHRVSEALGVMTHQIREEGGVVGDFHGDAAMGFWGWPFAQEDAVERACRAALAIRAAFAEAARRNDDPLTGFRVGIGIASGRAVAGKIGTVDQVKVTAFGPVVNLASRLEGLTKDLRTEILLDERSAHTARARLPSDVARVRRVARVRPYGLDSALEVSELLPPFAVEPKLTDEHLAAYERALDALQAGQWATAFQLLHLVPADDRVKDFLTVFIAQHNRTAPENWDGIIPMTSK